MEIDEKKYKSWKSKFDKHITKTISVLKKDVLDKMNLSVTIDSDYNFIGGKSRWLAAYRKSERMIENNIILISINHKHIYDEMKKRDIENDNFNIEAQAKITIGHEIAHGIIDFLNTNKIMKHISSRKEEELAEEFGEYMFPKATYVYHSELIDLLNRT